MQAKLLVLFTLLLFSFNTQSQLNSLKYSTKQSLLVVDISKTGEELNQFILENKLQPKIYDRKKNKINIQITMGQREYEELNRLIKLWGYIEAENSLAINHQDSLEDIRMQKAILTKEKTEYQKLVTLIDSSSNEKYFDYWEKIITIQKSIDQLIKQINAIERSNRVYTYNLLIKEEKSAGSFYDNSWINMPGLEYSILFTEQPEIGISPKIMHGISLKYMFNWYKSYGVLGLYKSPNTSSNTEVDETYIFAYGQDFYARSLGRGQRKFLNLYSSFNLGVYVSTSESDRTTSWFVNPFLGIELYKSKRILIDNKVGYFLPYKTNRIQRGLLYNFSFNFIL